MRGAGDAEESTPRRLTDRCLNNVTEQLMGGRRTSNARMIVRAYMQTVTLLVSMIVRAVCAFFLQCERPDSHRTAWQVLPNNRQTDLRRARFARAPFVSSFTNPFLFTRKCQSTSSAITKLWLLHNGNLLFLSTSIHRSFYGAYFLCCRFPAASLLCFRIGQRCA